MSSGILSYFPCCTCIPVSCSVKLGNTEAGGMLLMCPWIFLMLLIPTIKPNKIQIINAASQSPFELVLTCQRTLSRHNKVESCSLSATCSPNTSAAKASLHLHTGVLTVCCCWSYVCLFFKYQSALALMSFKETLDPVLNKTTLRAWL